MKIVNQLNGMIPAMATPLDSNQHIDRESHQRLIDKVFDNGANGIMILGTIGEGMDILSDQYGVAVHSAVKCTRGRGPVIVGVGGMTVEKVTQNIRLAADNGANVALCVPPFYHVLSQDIILEFYTTIANSSPIPLMIYNMPALTKNVVELPTVSKLTEHKNIIGIKDSSGNFIYFQQLVCKFQNDEFKVFMGRAPLALSSILFGASGTMTPIPNLNPELEKSLYSLVTEGNLQKARATNQKIQEIVQVFSLPGIPISASIKGLLSKMDICTNYTADIIPVLSKESIDILYAKYLSVLCLGK